MKDKLIGRVNKIGNKKKVKTLGQLCDILQTDWSVIAAIIQPEFKTKAIWAKTRLKQEVLDAVAIAFADLCVLKIGNKDLLYKGPGLRMKRYHLQKRKLGMDNIKDSIISRILDEAISDFNKRNVHKKNAKHKVN